MADKTKILKILQLNCQNAQVVNAEITDFLASENATDVVLLQDPYDVGSLDVPGYRKHYRGFSDVYTCILVREGLPSVMLTDFSNECSAVVRVKISKNKEITFQSAYFKYCQDIKPHINLLEKLFINAKKEKHTLLSGVDTNAHSLLWYSADENERGQLLEDCVLANDIRILNQPSEISTFHNERGIKSNIDVTFVTPDLDTGKCEWTVRDLFTSDHNPIMVTVSLDQHLQETKSKTFKYSCSRLDSKGFHREFQARAAAIRDVVNVGNVDEAVEKLMKSIEECAGTAKCTPGRRRVRMTGALREMRDKVRECRRRARNKETDHPVSVAYRLLRNQYVNKIRQARKDSIKVDFDRLTTKNMWEFVEKYAPKMKKVPFCATTIRMQNGSTTKNLDETVEALLTKFFPIDDFATDDPEQAEKRCSVERYENDLLVSESFSEEELEEAVAKCKRRKSPGPDEISTEFLLKIWPTIKETVLHIYNQCLESGSFPRKWKIGRVTIIPKPDKEQDDIKGYRPITLLDLLGKILERLILQRLENHIQSKALISDNQYGFRPGKGTVDFLYDLHQKVQTSQHKYVLAIFLDISAAFDSVWRPHILHILTESECPGNLYRVIKSYLSDRNVFFDYGGQRWEKEVTLGVPQGSILGPILWDVAMDEALNLPFEGTVDAQAYADDEPLLVHGNSRSEIEQKSVKALEKMHNWGGSAKLAFGSEKTSAVLLKGKLKRKPHIVVDGNKVAVKESNRVLGVELSEGLDYDPHIAKVSEKAKTVFANLICSMQKHRRLPFRVKLLLYNAVFLGIITYAAPIWGHRARLVMNKRKLVSAQRAALLLVTGCSRTTSNAALPVIAGVLPIVCQIELLRETYLRKRNPGAHPSKAEIKARIIDEWQQEWESSETGDTTRMFWPDVKVRLQQKYIRSGPLVCQVLSGHGEFREKLHKLTLSDSPLCRDCGAIDTPVHAMFQCPLIPVDPSLRFTSPPYDECPFTSAEEFERFYSHAMAVMERRYAALDSLQ